MIQLVKGTKPKLRLTPRQGFKRTHKELELDLVYGHSCSTCSNVINVLAKSKTDIDLYPFEETGILSQGEKNAGELLKVIPNDKDAQRSAYKKDFLVGSDPSQEGLLQLRLINHIVRVGAIKDKTSEGEGIEELGERPCFKIGVFSRREDLMIKDLLLLFGFQHSEFLTTYKVPKVTELFPDRAGSPDCNREFQWTPAVGEAPPVILVSRNYLKHGYNYFLRQIMDARYKKA
jgi:hypothetical protein